jgi:2-dehydropantoate 2-reductase
MKIAIVGAGGVGGYFGGKIALAGFDTTFIARGEHYRAIKNKGLYVKSINGDFAINPAQVTDDINDIKDADLVILGIKAWQVSNMAKTLSGIIDDHATVLPLQNGVLAYDELSAILGKKRVINGLCRIFSKIEAPGIIVHPGIDPAIIFGETDNVKSQRALDILDIFQKSGIKSRIADNIQTELWKKFINICVSGLLAVTRSTYGQIRELKETRNLMEELFEEVYAIAYKLDIPIESDFIGKTMAFIDTFDYEATSSLTRDIWDGKPSELEYQNGTVVRFGEKYGIKTPVNRFIYQCLLPQETRARKTQDL